MHIAIIGPPSRLRTELIDLLLHDGHTIHLNDPPSERQAFRSTLVHIGAIEQRVGTEDLTIAIGSEVDEADLQILPPSDASIGIIVHDLVDSMTDSPWYAEELDVFSKKPSSKQMLQGRDGGSIRLMWCELFATCSRIR